MIEEFQCQVRLCSDTVRVCTIYNMIIPDINATSRRILRRPGLFYFHWLPSSAVELYNRDDGLCNDVNLYAMKNYVQGQMIIRYTPLIMVGLCMHCS